MYSDPKAPEMYAEYANITPAVAKMVRDKFYSKSMLQMDEVRGLDGLMADAVAFKYMHKPLTLQEQQELLQLPGKL